MGAPGFQLTVEVGMEQLGLSVTSVLAHTSTLLAVRFEVGVGLMVTLAVAALQPVLVCVKVKLTTPGAMPVTTPALLTEAMEGLLLCQVPPEVGESVMDRPVQSEDCGVLTTGGAWTVMIAVRSGVAHNPWHR